MRRHLVVVLAFVAVLAGARTLRAADEHPWNNKRIYYVIESMGHMVEKGVSVRRLGSYRKSPCWVVEEERSFYAPGNPVPVRNVRTRTTTTMDGFALQRGETSLMGDGAHETITITGPDAVFDAGGAYGGPAVVPIPGPVLFEVTGECLASFPMRVGAEHTVFVLDRSTRGVITTGIRLVGVESPGVGGRPAVLQADITTPGRPPVRARYTSDGRLLRLEGSGIVYQVVGRSDYEAGRIPPESLYASPELLATAPPFVDGADAAAPAPVDPYGTAASEFGQPGMREPAQPTPPVMPRRGPVGDITIPVGEDVPAWDSFGWLVMQADPAYDWSRALPNSEYMHVELMGSRMLVTAVRNAPRIDDSVVFPMTVPAEIQSFLGASPQIPSDHLAVIEAAYVAVADADSKREERNVLRAVSYLAGWIYQSVALEPWSGYDSSALDALARRSGDSLGHARLFSAMARTLGVPTRLCQGLLTNRGRAALHCWTEAWINGKWIPIDTTVSRVGLPAGYILAERDDGRGAFRIDFAEFLRNPRLRMQLLSAGRESPSGRDVEMRIGDRRSYAVTERDWMANLYWGFALRLPEGWRGSTKMDSVEMKSPDGRGNVKCEALEGDFRAGRDELESTVESLRSGLRNFKVNESRIVAFDAAGSTPALYVDFTCEREGEATRGRQYVVPRRQRAFRITFWAPAERFERYSADFDSILASFEF